MFGGEVCMCQDKYMGGRRWFVSAELSLVVCVSWGGRGGLWVFVVCVCMRGYYGILCILCETVVIDVKGRRCMCCGVKITSQSLAAHFTSS